MSPSHDSSALLDTATAVAHAAARELRQHFRTSLILTTKSSSSDLVTEADQAAEQAVANALASRAPFDGAVGEEGLSKESSTGLYWIIDPLDGTTNFVYGRKDFAVSVAVIAAESIEDAACLKGSLLAGVVFAPLRAELYAASQETPSTCNGVHIAP